MLDKVFAAFFLLIGTVFWLFLIWIGFGDPVPGQAQAAAILFCIGAVFLYIGYRWLPTEQPHRLVWQAEWDLHLLVFRRPAEYLAVLGIILAAVRAGTLVLGSDLITGKVLLTLSWAPVLIGLLLVRILRVGGYRPGVFSDDLLLGWPRRARIAVSLFLRIGSLGYLAICGTMISPLESTTWLGSVGVQVMLSLLLCLLYASQLLILHLGNMRSAADASQK